MSRLCWAAAGCAVILALSACTTIESSPPVQASSTESSREVDAGSAAGPTFETVEQLSAGADVVVTGRVGATLGRQVDDGGDGTGNGLPLVLHEVVVEQVLVGEPEDDRIVVAMVDGQVGAGMQTSTLSEGDQLLLYLRRETEATAPGVDVDGEFYTPLNFGNGVLRVDGDVAIPTGPLPNRLDDDAPPPPPPSVADNGEEARPEKGGPMPIEAVIQATVDGATSR